MANGFDPANYVSEAPDANAQAAAVDSTGFDPSNYQGEEPKPGYIDGSVPEKAINESPLDFTDRLKMAAGNPEGNIAYLQQKYGPIHKDSQGNLTVQQNGVWRQVDEQDAWNLSKKIANAIPIAASIGAQIGAEAAAIPAVVGLGATGVGIPGGIALALGAPAAGAAAAELGRTSLGRLVGTYQAEPEEQLRDIGVESLLGMGGYVMGLGVKPTAQVMAKGWNALAQTLKNAPAESKDVIAAYTKAMTGNTDKQVRTFIDDPNYGPNKFKDFGAKSSAEDIADATKLDSVYAMKDVADSAQKGLSGMWRNLTEEMVSEPGVREYQLNGKDIINGVRQTGIENGILKVVRKGTDQEIRSAEELATISPLRVDYMVKAPSELINSTSPLVLTDTAKNLLGKMYSAFDVLQHVKPAKGEMAARQAMALRSSLKSTIKEIEQKAIEEEVTSILPIIRASMDSVDASLKGGLDTVTNGGYSKMLGKYAEGETVFKPLLEAQTASIKARSLKPYENLYEQIYSPAGVNAVEKSAMTNSLTVVNNYAPKEVAKIVNESIDTMNKNDAFNAMSKAVRSKGQAAGVLRYGVGGLLMSGNPKAIASAAAGLAATSPGLTASAIRGAANMSRGIKATSQAINAGLGVNEFLRRLPKKQLADLVQNPKALQSLLGTVMEAPATFDSTHQQLMQTLNGQ